MLRDIIRRIWEAIESQTPSNLDPIAAINATMTGGLADAWRDVMADNWNAPPMTALDSHGTTVPMYVAWDGLRSNSASNSKTWAWTIGSMPDGGSLNVMNDSTQNQQSANPETTALTADVPIKENGQALPASKLNEYQWETRTAPGTAPRIEGFSVRQGPVNGMAIYQWPGLGQIDGPHTVSCRWSFP